MPEAARLLASALLLALALALPARAQTAAPPDSSAPDSAAADSSAPALRHDAAPITARPLDADRLAGFRDDPVFRYERDPGEAAGWWGRFLEWLGELLFGEADEALGSRAMDWVFYGLALLGILYAVLRLLRMERSGLFSRRPEAAPLAFEAVEHDPRTLDLAALVDEAVARHDFRGAVRLLYLQALGALAEAGHIVWQRDKTNHEYLDELRDAALRRDFAALTLLFEYVWYGDFPVEADRFERVRPTFDRFVRRLARAEVAA